MMNAKNDFDVPAFAGDLENRTSRAESACSSMCRTHHLASFSNQSCKHPLEVPIIRPWRSH